jgi:poly(3-hydroxybutyrate) depolymerase
MGFSNGGMMTNRLACEATDVFRGVAPFQGDIRTGGSFAECTPSKPISWISFCGTEDSACNSGQNTSFKLFAENNKCVGDPVPTYVTPTTSCEAYTNCKDGTFVENCWNEGMVCAIRSNFLPNYSRCFFRIAPLLLWPPPPRFRYFSRLPASHQHRWL